MAGEEEVVRIRATLDNADLKARGDESVRTLAQVRAQVAALPASLKQTSQSFAGFSSSVVTFSQVGQSVQGRINNLGQVTEKAGHGFNRLRGPLQNVALGLVGIEGPAGKVVERLGEFAVGGGLTLAITAGMALIVAAINNIGEAARKEQERVNGLRDSLLEAAKARAADFNPYKALAVDAAALLKQQQELSAELAKVQKPKTVTGGGAIGGLVLPVDLARVKELKRQIDEIGKALTERSLQAQEQAKINSDKAAAEAERIRNKQEQLAREAERHAAQRKKELGSIEDAELELAAIRAKADNDSFALEEAARAKGLAAIERQLAEVKELNEVERERLRAMLEQVNAGQALLRMLEAQAKNLQQIAALSRQGSQNLQTDIFNSRRPGDQRVGGAVPDPFGPGGAQGLVNANARRLTLKNIGGGLAQNLGGQLAGALSTGHGALGAGLGGALSGFLSGGPVGAIVGGIGGLIGGLFGGNKKRKEELARRAELRDQISNFTDSIAPKGNATQQALADLKKRFEDLYTEGKKAGLTTKELAKLTADYQAAAARLEQEFADQTARFRENLEVRALEAKGLTEEATNMRAQLAAEEELRAAQKEGYDAMTIARLKEVQGLEAEAAAKKAAAAAAAALRQLEEQRTTVLEDLAEREARLTGGNADQIAIENRAKAELRAAKDQLDAGTLTEELYTRLAAVINGELNQALQDLTTQAAEAAQAAADAAAAQAAAQEQAQLELRDSIRIRELRLAGLDAEAAAAEGARQKANELKEAVAGGATADDLARLAAVLDGELSQALQNLTDAAIAKAAELKKAEDDFRGDIRVQLLRSSGQGDAADQLELEQRQASALADAISKGFGNDTIGLLKQLQASQRAQLLEDQRAKLDAAAGRIQAGSAGSSTIAEVRTISGGQADTMIGYLASIAAYTRQMALAATGTAAGAGSQADKTLAGRTALAGQAAGVRPSL